MSQTYSITRDNFDPGKVLQSLRIGGITPSEGSRLLEEACHAIARRDAVIDRARMTVRDMLGSFRD